MQKNLIQTPVKNKNINYFIYEMKDTNQLLKDLISCNMSDTMSRSGQNKEQIINQQIYKDNHMSTVKINITNTVTQKNKNNNIKSIDSSIFRQQVNVKYEDSYQNDQNNYYNIIEPTNQNIKDKNKKSQNILEDLILQKFYIDSEQQQQQEEINKSYNIKHNKKDYDLKGINDYQIKQTKKQKKGLANISLRVKNIVSEHKKLSYKQVSDLVLQYSKDQIDQLEESQKIKQIKNIKRRVYDALNVLVAMGILGKHQRCVTNTQWTNIPGKKHSNQWQNANNKIDQISRLKKSCVDKEETLKLLMKKYNAIAALRNKHKIQQQQQNQQKLKLCGQINIKLEQDQIQTHKNNQFVNINYNQIQFNTQKYKKQKDQKLQFPILAFCPSFQDQNDKMKVDLDITQDNEQKMIISAKSIMIFGDFDCALELDLEKYRNKQQQKLIQKDINDYANQSIKKKFQNQNHHKYLHDHQEIPDIQDYFNDHVFDPK